MAKCPRCNGTGISPNNKKARCSFCFGTGTTNRKVVPLTNEEWFCGLSTEEKAMVIVLCCPYEADWFGENFEKRMEQRMKNLSHSTYGYEKGINKIKNWLEEIHE